MCVAAVPMEHADDMDQDVFGDEPEVGRYTHSMDDIELGRPDASARGSLGLGTARCAPADAVSVCVFPSPDCQHAVLSVANPHSHVRVCRFVYVFLTRQPEWVGISRWSCVGPGL